MPHPLNALRIALFAGLAMLLSSCSSGRSDWLPAGVKGYNHTSAAINHFYLGPPLGPAGGPNLGPHSGGGGETCCGVLPRQWQPMRVLVEWEKDSDPYAYGEWPEPMYSEGWRERMKQHRAKYTRHSVYVDVPPYGANGEDFGPIQVHFLPCDQVRISTSLLAPNHPDYPDKEYFNVKEPATCPTP